MTVTDIRKEQNQKPDLNHVNSTAATAPSLAAPTSHACSRSKKPYILAVAVQLAILAGLGAFNMYVLATGRTVPLSTVPADPWDMFRGNYLVLRYDISTIRTTQDFQPGQEVFVVLEKKNPYWSVSYVLDKMPKLTDDEVALKGKIAYTTPKEIHMHYGLEQYFLPEGNALLSSSSRPDVEIAVDQFGNSAIKQVMLNGKKIVF
jgi:uncharacterized membrane-anchored protein